MRRCTVSSPCLWELRSPLGYDMVVGGAIVYLGVTIGYASGTFNPYTIGIAQDVAGVPLYSGLGLRIAV